MNELISYTDLMTFIEMRTKSHVNSDIDHEPVTWELYNKVVDLVENPLSGKGKGNYIPALELAYDVLESTEKFECATSVLFLSDGWPSDHEYLRIPAYDNELIFKITKKICSKYRERLTFGFFGYAHDDGK